MTESNINININTNPNPNPNLEKEKEKEIETETHILNDTWSVYFHDPNDDRWDRSSFKKVTDVSTIERFWQLNNLLHDKLHTSMWFLMRSDIFPLWEEKENKSGGYISLKVLKTKVTDCWENLCSRVLTESILHSNYAHMWDQINGVSVSPKRSFCIFKIWLKTPELGNPSLFKISTPESSEVLFKSYASEESTTTSYVASTNTNTYIHTDRRHGSRSFSTRH
jgi:hypothetical protein